MTISISEKESEILNYKVGRVSLSSDIDFITLKKKILEQKIDICRLKVSLSDKAIFEKLKQLNWLYAPYSIIINQELELKNIDNKKLTHSLNFVEYKNTYEEKELLSKLVFKIFEKNDMNVYYKNDLYDLLIPKEKRFNALLNYVLEVGLKKGAKTYLAFNKSEVIGFSVIEFIGDTANASLAGILPDQRGKSFFTEFVRHQILMAKHFKCTRYLCNTIVFNFKSLQTTLKEGLTVKDVFLNVNIFPLLQTFDDSFCLQETLNGLIFKLINTFEERGKNVVEWKVSKPSVASKISTNWEVKEYKKIKTLIFNDSEKEMFGYVKYD